MLRLDGSGYVDGFLTAWHCSHGNRSNVSVDHFKQSCEVIGRCTRYDDGSLMTDWFVVYIYSLSNSDAVGCYAEM